jgi:hypothetical protein
MNEGEEGDVNEDADKNVKGMEEEVNENGGKGSNVIHYLDMLQ